MWGLWVHNLIVIFFLLELLSRILYITPILDFRSLFEKRSPEPLHRTPFYKSRFFNVKCKDKGSSSTHRNMKIIKWNKNVFKKGFSYTKPWNISIISSMSFYILPYIHFYVRYCALKYCQTFQKYIHTSWLGKKKYIIKQP